MQVPRDDERSEKVALRQLLFSLLSFLFSFYSHYCLTRLSSGKFSPALASQLTLFVTTFQQPGIFSLIWYTAFPIFRVTTRMVNRRNTKQLFQHLFSNPELLTQGGINALHKIAEDLLTVPLTSLFLQHMLKWQPRNIPPSWDHFLLWIWKYNCSLKSHSAKNWEAALVPRWLLFLADCTELSELNKKTHSCSSVSHWFPKDWPGKVDLR